MNKKLTDHIQFNLLNKLVFTHEDGESLKKFFRSSEGYKFCKELLSIRQKSRNTVSAKQIWYVHNIQTVLAQPFTGEYIQSDVRNFIEAYEIAYARAVWKHPFVPCNPTLSVKIKEFTRTLGEKLHITIPSYRHFVGHLHRLKDVSGNMSKFQIICTPEFAFKHLKPNIQTIEEMDEDLKSLEIDVTINKFEIDPLLSENTFRLEWKPEGVL